MDARIEILAASAKIAEQRARACQNRIDVMADEPGINEPKRAALYVCYATLRDKWIQAAYKATELIQDIEWQNRYEEWYR